MLREIIAVWKGESFMNKVVEEFVQMLKDADSVFEKAWNIFKDSGVNEQTKSEIYEKDKSVNKKERKIRRMLLEHLSINPQQDVSGCLAMISLVKDAERIGDYAKNIFEVGILMGDKLKDMQYITRLSDIQSRINRHFITLTKAFTESDDTSAKKVLEDYKSIKEECNNVLNDLLNDSMSNKEAVSTALLSRYFKRINSHISNIASGLVYPLDRIDFVRGDLLE
ncbi:MAG: PhoU domain-containing protein [Candidatus Gygaella obscura]|nr:PhoU domain-containing protein [Candidatus Gygaella obscura]